MDARTFASRYGAVYHDLYRFVLCMMGRAHDAEDAVSEAVLAGFRQRHQLRSDEAFKSWMFAILANVCRKRLKGAARVEPVADFAAARTREPSAAFDGRPLSDDSAGDLREDVRAAFAAVSEEERLIVSLSVFGGYTSAEIGSVLELNANTVRSKRKRALEKMAAELKEVAR